MGLFITGQSISLPAAWTTFSDYPPKRQWSAFTGSSKSAPRSSQEGPGVVRLHGEVVRISVTPRMVMAAIVPFIKHRTEQVMKVCVSSYRILLWWSIYEDIYVMNRTQSCNISVQLRSSHFPCLTDTHLMTKYKLIKIIMVACIEVESIYLCVWLNLCINRLPSANLIWTLVAGMESSIRMGALRMDFSSSSGEEGVLTISGVRLEDWNEIK